MPSSACKCVFYTGQNIMQKRNIPTDRAQRIDEKNGIIFLAIMFTPRVKVIKMSKIAHFLFYTVWARYLSAPERSY